MKLPSNTLHAFVAALCGLSSVFFIISTYGTLTQTYDEPFHIATGMEWLQHGEYTIENLHPPLARVAVALGLYLSGNTLTNWHQGGPKLKRHRAWQQGNRILHSGNTYTKNLSLARLGVLPFFILTACVVWLWTRMLFGSVAALFAVILFTTLPPILAHSGLATTDMPAAATFFAALFCFVVWLRKEDLTRSSILGVAVGLALTSKFSNFLFLPCCMVAIGLLYFVKVEKTKIFAFERIGIVLRNLFLIAAITLTTICATYRFTVDPLSPIDARPHRTIDRLFGEKGRVHDITYAFVEAPIFPFMGMYHGLQELRSKNQAHGTGSLFVLGKIRAEPVWYYFPLVLLVKTPIPFIVLVIIGISLMFQSWHGSEWGILAPGIAIIAFLLVCLPITIHAGVRHILGIYPLMAIIAGHTLSRLMINKSILLRCFAGTLLLWQIGAVLYSNPDYLPYFNELVGDKPETVLPDENLDWGQDLGRLAVALKSRGVGSIALACVCSADLSKHNLPNKIKMLKPYERVSGYIAISISLLKQSKVNPALGYQWLEDYKPISLVGKTILLYQIPASE